ncbi:DUF1203 domain-containing protein [Caulobacter sp. RHG1]|uniref:DUF1203 domain-containing protein n=1 Tax=Caulobacter sp. (strain RHG1) TaxID=2545762 RepID=UPI001553C22A|nr:DUF1203 domain-containing protein [Caulobacter sp. RHG1]NQE62555.1 hypothetical protein [Caulobacter sp. RHG1]
MTYAVTSLPAELFAPLFAMDDEALAARGARRMIADAPVGYPCRVSLDDAQPGETLILVNYEHQSAPTPFRASHAVFVREGVAPVSMIGEMPPALRRRLLSLRAFDTNGMMIAADIVDGAEASNLIAQMFENAQVAYLHAHYAKWGCYAARIDRA